MNNHYLNIILKSIILLLLLLPVVILSFMGTYSRALSDDYCDAYRVIQFGVIGAAYQHYMTFEGRFSTNIIKDLVIGWSPFALIPFMPLIYILVFIIGAFLTMFHIFDTLPKKTRGYYSLVFALAILVVFLSVIPDINQSFYWAGAAIINFLPSVFFIFYCFSLLSWSRWRVKSDHKKAAYIHYAIAFLVPFFAGGLTEVFAVFEAALFILAILIAIVWIERPDRKDYVRFFIISLLGAILALILIAVAPGTAVRQATKVAQPNLINFLRISVTSLVSIFSNIIRYPSKIISLLGLCALAAFGEVHLLKLEGRTTLSKTQLYLLLILIPFSVIILMYACILPAAYALSTGLPTRTQSIPIFVLVLGVVVWGFFWGILHEKTLFAGVDRKVFAVYGAMFFLLLNSIPVFSAGRVWRDGANLRTYATQWDAMHSQILLAKQNDESEVILEPLIDWANRGSITPDPENWVNRCASRLYGITIRTK
jgi:hypothetical protein